MQQTEWQKTVLSLGGLAILSTLVLLACADKETRNVDTTASPIPVNSTTVAALLGLGLIMNNGAVFHADIGNNPVVLTFTSASAFTLARGNAAASGTVTFGSCTLTFTSSFPAGQGPQAGDRADFPTCVFSVKADAVEVDGDSKAGTLIFTLINAAGVRSDNRVRPLTVDVSIRADGRLFVTNPGTRTDVDTGIDTDPIR